MEIESNIGIEDIRDIAEGLNFKLSEEQLQEILEEYPSCQAQADSDALGDMWWNVVEQQLYADYEEFQTPTPKKVRRPSEFRQLLVVEIQDSVLYDVHSLCGTDDGILREWAEKKFIDLASDCVSNWDEYTADDRNTCLEEGYIKYGNGNSICITGLTQYSCQ